MFEPSCNSVLSTSKNVIQIKILTEARRSIFWNEKLKVFPNLFSQASLENVAVSLWHTQLTDFVDCSRGKDYRVYFPLSCDVN